MLNIGTKSDNTAGASGELTAAEFNDHNEELQGAVEATGQILSGSTLLQLAKALFINGVSAQTVVDSGSANSVVLAPLTGGAGLQVSDNYAELNGAVLKFTKSTPNTSTSVTVNFGQTGTELSAKSLKRIDGSDPEIGDVDGVCLVQWDNTNDQWILIDNGGSTFSRPVSNLDTYTPVFKKAQLIGGTTVGDANITIEDGKFIGQEITLSNQGTGFATYTHPDFAYGIIVDPDHNPIIKWVSDGIGGFKWDVGSQVTSKYAQSSKVITLYSDRKMTVTYKDLPCAHVASGVLQGVITYSRPFTALESVVEGGFVLISGVPTSSWETSNSVINVQTLTQTSVVVYIASGSVSGNLVTCNVDVIGEY